jgi:hypothetical protein
MRYSDGVAERKMPRPRAFGTMPVYFRTDLCTTSRWPDTSLFVASGQRLGGDGNPALFGAQWAGCLVNWNTVFLSRSRDAALVRSGMRKPSVLSCRDGLFEALRMQQTTLGIVAKACLRHTSFFDTRQLLH